MERIYRTPRVQRYGTMRSLTRGASGSVTDTDGTDVTDIPADGPQDADSSFKRASRSEKPLV